MSRSDRTFPLRLISPFMCPGAKGTLVTFMASFMLCTFSVLRAKSSSPSLKIRTCTPYPSFLAAQFTYGFQNPVRLKRFHYEILCPGPYRIHYHGLLSHC